MTTARASRVGLAVLLTVVAAPVGARAAEFLEFYKLGLAAVESEDWASAVEMMREAIARQPAEKMRIKRSLFFRRYLPHFYLGRALFENGDCPAALAAWRESEAQGVVSRLPEFEELNAGWEACRQRRSELEFARTEARRVIERAESTAAATRRSLAELSEVGEPAAALWNRLAGAEETVRRSRSSVVAQATELRLLEQAAAAAAEADERLAAIGREADRQLVTVRARRTQLTTELQAAVSEAGDQLAAIEYLEPYPPGVSQHRQAVLGVLERLPASDRVLTVGELEALRSELESVTRDLRRATEPPPQDLTRAAEAFLAGEYTQTLDSLSDHEFASARARSHAHLLAAAALFALAHSAGSEDADLLSRAREEVAACRAADPQRSPSARVFSPRFITFFEREVANARASDSVGPGAPR